MPNTCLCGCGGTPTGLYRVVRGHAGRVKSAPRLRLMAARRANRERHDEGEVLKEVPRARECRRCDRTFTSWGRANRLCQRCREAIPGEPTPETVRSVGHSVHHIGGIG